MHRLSIILIFLLTILSLQTALAQDYKMQLEQVGKFLSEKYNRNTPGCVVGIIKNGKLIYNKGFGMANLDFDIPMTPATTINIMSVSKQFTAACIALLLIEQKLSLNDEIHKYIPELPDYGHKITIEHLVRHTSGLRDFSDLVDLSGRSPEDLATRADALAIILRQKELNFVPGDRYAYSNSGYTLLTYIVERVSGLSFSDFAKRRLFDPLGMSDSFFSDNTHQIVKNRAVSYGKDENGKYFSYNLNDNRIGCAGLFSTIEDLYKWDDNFYNGKVGGEKFNQLMVSLKPFNNGKENDYAFGNIIDRHEGFGEVLHSGGLLGIRCKISRFPSERLSIIYLGNGSQNLNEEFYPIASLFLVNKSLPKNTQNTAANPASTPELKNDQTAKPKIISGSELDSFTGTYFSEELRSFIDLKREGDNLIVGLGQKTYKAPVLGESRQLRFNHSSLMVGSVTITFPKGESNAKQSFTVSTERTSKLKFIKTVIF